MRQVAIPHQAPGQYDVVANAPREEGAEEDGVESSLDRFREQSFFAEECLDLLASLRADPVDRASFKRAGYRQAWLADVIHQREVLEQMSNVLLTWETVEADSTGDPQCDCR